MNHFGPSRTQKDDLAAQHHSLPKQNTAPSARRENLMARGAMKLFVAKLHASRTFGGEAPSEAESD